MRIVELHHLAGQLLVEANDEGPNLLEAMQVINILLHELPECFHLLYQDLVPVVHQFCVRCATLVVIRKQTIVRPLTSLISRLDILDLPEPQYPLLLVLNCLGLQIDEVVL